MGQQLLDLVASAFGGLGYGAIFFLMALESSVFPVPSEFVMAPAGYLALAGKLDPWLAIMAGGAGSLVGALANYWVLGRWLGRPFLEKYGRWVGVTPDKYARSEKLFLRGAGVFTFVGRFIPVVRHVISIPAGIFRMPLAPFALLTLAGATLWCGVLVGAGWFFGPRVVAVFAEYSHLVTSGIAGVVALVALFWTNGRVRARWGWRGLVALRAGFVVLAYASGFFWIAPLEMSLAFPRGGHAAMTVPGERVFLKGSDGARVSAVFTGSAANGAVLYLHGNGGPLPKFADDIAFFAGLGYAVLAPDYPGYGESAGTPTEANVYGMAEKAFGYLAGTKGVPPSKIVVAGYSIGTGPAAELALRHPDIAGLALLAPYESLQRMARAAYGAAPQAWWFRPDTFATSDKAARISVPVLVVHGDADRVVPFSQGETVFRSLGSAQKEFLRLPGAGHDGLASGYGPAIAEAWSKAFPKR